MNGESPTSPFVDLRAVGYGALWGVAIVGIGAIVQQMVMDGTPLAPGVDHLVRLGLQGFAALLGGLIAGWRSAGVGWLHGALAGMALILSIAAIMGVTTALPALADILVFAGVGTGAGILGGITGVNLTRR